MKGTSKSREGLHSLPAIHSSVIMHQDLRRTTTAQVNAHHQVVNTSGLAVTASHLLARH